MRLATLTLTFRASALTAQSQEEIAAAIARLDGDREDARAIEFLIDAGKPAVGPLLDELGAAYENPADVKLARFLRVLRAMGTEGAEACPILGDLLCDPFFILRPKGHGFLRIGPPR